GAAGTAAVSEGSRGGRRAATSPTRHRTGTRTATRPSSSPTSSPAVRQRGPGRSEPARPGPGAGRPGVPGDGSGADGVEAAVDVDDLAGGRREPVRHQRDAGAGRPLGVLHVPAERGPPVPDLLELL